MTHKCHVCGGNTVHTTTTYTQWLDGRLIVVENVPAWVCDQCGETVFDPDVVERLQAVMWSDAQPVRVIEASVYDLSTVSAHD